jgi:hypothetical protein
MFTPLLFTKLSNIAYLWLESGLTSLSIGRTGLPADLLLECLTLALVLKNIIS